MRKDRGKKNSNVNAGIEDILGKGREIANRFAAPDYCTLAARSALKEYSVGQTRAKVQ